MRPLIKKGNEMKKNFKIGVLIFSAILLIAVDVFAVTRMENVLHFSEATAMLLFGTSLIVTFSLGRKILVSRSVSKNNL